MSSFISKLGRRIRHLWRKISQPSEISFHGVKLRFPDKISTNLRDVLYREDYELNELHALNALLKPDDRVLEIGSSIGFLTISACKIVGAENVVAIEANPFIVDYARKNFDVNGVSPILHEGMATAEASGDLKTFYIYDDFWSSSETSRKGQGEEQRIDCKTIPVNTIIAEHKANVLICDIEGGEIALLPALKLNGFKTLIIEFHPEISSQREIRRVVSHILNAEFSIDIRASTGDTLVFTHI